MPASREGTRYLIVLTLADSSPKRLQTLVLDLQADFLHELAAQGRQQGLARLDSAAGRRPDDDGAAVAGKLEPAEQDPVVLVQDDAAG